MHCLRMFLRNALQGNRYLEVPEPLLHVYCCMRTRHALNSFNSMAQTDTASACRTYIQRHTLLPGALADDDRITDDPRACLRPAVCVGRECG